LLFSVYEIHASHFVSLSTTAGSDLESQPRKTQSFAEEGGADAVGGTFWWDSAADQELASVCRHTADGSAVFPRKCKTEVQANCRH